MIGQRNGVRNEVIVTVIGLVGAMLLAVCPSAALRASTGEVRIDSSPDRVKTPLKVDLPRIGSISPRSVRQIRSSNWTIDGCPVDRDFVDFEKYRDYLPPLGIRKIRILSGWAKSEKIKGQIDVSWLDRIVDWCTGNGISVMLELSYGNPIYDGGGGPGLADGMPDKPEGLAAWDRWVSFLVEHFKGRVNEWAMWNEPDNKPKPGHAPHTPEQIAAFNVRSAKIVRARIPDARIHGLSLAHNDPEFLERCLIALGEDVRLFDTFVYHGYVANPDSSYLAVERQKALVAKYAPHARLRQGENGCSSDYIDRLSLQRISWTEFSQAKWDMRRMLGDLGHDVESSVFGIADINYAPPAHAYAFCNRKGLLRLNPSNDVIRVKRAYYAVQNVAAVFDDSVTRVKDSKVSTTDRTVSLYEYQTDKECPIFAFWEHGATQWDRKTGTARISPDDRPGDSFLTRPLVLEWKGRPIENPVWVDLLSGRVYALPDECQIVHSCGVTFVDIPLYDSPCLLTERGAIRLQ